MGDGEIVKLFYSLDLPHPATNASRLGIGLIEDAPAALDT